MARLSWKDTDYMHVGGFVKIAWRAVGISLAGVLAAVAAVAIAQPAHAEIRNTPGYVHLRNIESGTCVDAQDDGPGARIVMWRCLNTTYEEWQQVQVAIPGNRFHHCACVTVTMLVNHAVEMCMAVENDSLSSGTKVVQQNCDASDEKQWWVFSALKGSPITSFISKKVLDVDLGRSDNGVPLQIWTYYHNPN
jgi:hypothetical protein